jgi:hypothetical protein
MTGRESTMSNADYLERYHELTTKILSEIAIRNGRGDFEDSALLLTQLMAKQDSLWTQYMTSASAGVNP